jgi:hypothetical protein
MRKKNQTDLRRETHTSWEQKNEKKNLPGQGNEKTLDRAGEKKLDREIKPPRPANTSCWAQQSDVSEKHLLEPQRMHTHTQENQIWNKDGERKHPCPEASWERKNLTETKRNLLVQKLSGREKTGDRPKKNLHVQKLRGATCLERKKKKKKKKKK